MTVKVYVGMGGNIGDAAASIKQAFELICGIEGTSTTRLSRLYRTTPVSPIPQADYVNAVCTFSTPLSLGVLFNHLQLIEKHIGKTPKHKNAPRIIDLDILFYGTEPYQDDLLSIPHPRWSERLFVLVPLSDLVQDITIGYQTLNISQMIAKLQNMHEENVILL